MPDSIDRRSFLKRGSRTLGGAALLGVGGPGLLEACSSTSSKSTSTSPSGASAAGGGSGAAGRFGHLDLQLPWIKNVESAGEFIADSQGIYTAQGFASVNLIAAGPSATPQETMVQTKKAFMAITSPDATAAAIAKGFTLKVIGTEYQKNPFCIMSAATKPIKTPQDMIGKKIGVQSVNEAVWAAFLKANNLDASKIQKVSVSFDPTPVTQGTVDGWFSFVTNEPVELKLKGFDTVTFLLNDYNYPEVGNVFIVRTDALKDSRDKVKAAMTAEILAWKKSIADPQAGADLAATKYGQGLDAKEQALESAAQNKLVATGDALSHGLFYMTPEAQAATLKTLALGGTTLTASQIFDMSILDEIYASADMKAVTAPSA